jgi:hypothetical protein
MSKSRVAPGSAQALVELRRARIRSALGVAPERAPVASSPQRRERIAFFRREAEELFWNELAWEQMTEEEAVVGGRLTELVFPGFLALIGGLLPSDSVRGPEVREYPDAVEEILTFLGERCVEYSAQLEAGADSRQLLWARVMTASLLDLVLSRLYGLSPEEHERIECLE